MELLTPADLGHVAFLAESSPSFGNFLESLKEEGFTDLKIGVVMRLPATIWYFGIPPDREGGI